MAGAMLGMNPDEVDALAQQMDTAGEQIQTAMNQVTAKLQGTTWEGNDRRQFESEWTSNAQRALTSVKNLLDQAATAARKNAQEQRTASNA